jgi:hypothetical protein
MSNEDLKIDPIQAPRVDFPTRRRVIGHFGYTCHAHLAREIFKAIFGTQWFWFSRTFNPSNNTDSSNPAKIYLLLSEAVQRFDVASRYIMGYKMSILETIIRHSRVDGVSALLQGEVHNASLESFRPRVIMMDIGQVAQRRRQAVDQLLVETRENARAHMQIPGQSLQPDEYLIQDIAPNELAVVIDG